MAPVQQELKTSSTQGTSAADETATAAPAATCAAVAQRILVAEDSPVTQDLLKLILEQRGHTVDLAADGEKALDALGRGSYDVVLLDFHLPKIDGLEVAARFRQSSTSQNIPRFVAITADIKGLLSHDANCENFDEVVPKPFELEDVLEVVEGKHDAREAAPAAPEKPATTANSVKMAGFFAQKYEFLRWPEDFSADRLSARGMHASLADGTFDAITLNEPATVRDLSVIWTTKTLHLLPIIDMLGSLPIQTDLDGSKVSIEETDELASLIESFHERRAQLHRDLVYTDDIGEKLIGRMFVSGRALTPRYDPSSRAHVSYNTVLDFRSIEKEMKDLMAIGYVGQQFFDRFHMCERCGSSHFNVREECTECSSANLHEEAYLHHFKCAYQGPESDFRQGDDLVCPKCRMELSHFSIDYDKPGSMMQCKSCKHATSEPDVGFVCMDCEARYDGETVGLRDVYSFELLESGLDFLKAGRAVRDGMNTALRFAELPLELIVLLNAELKKYEAEQKPFTLLNITYQNRREIEHGEGPRMFTQSRDLVLQNLRDTVRKDDCVVKGHNCDFVLLVGTEPKEARLGVDGLKAEVTSSMRTDLGVHVDVFGPEDFS